MDDEALKNKPSKGATVPALDEAKFARSLFARQLQTATRDDGSIDLVALSELVVERYVASSRNEQAARFLAVLENMPQGLCLFDGTGRLIVCNQRYSQIYGLRSEYVLPGTTFREIVDYRYAAGSTPVMTRAEYVLWRDSIAEANQPHESTVTLQDGRVIAIRHQPMSRGGWLATHEDITNRLRSERSLVDLMHNFVATGLPNRATTAEFLRDVLSSPNRKAPCAVLSVGFDGLQAVNDTLGRSSGDALLRLLSERLRTHLRAGDTLGQSSASEFIIIIQSETLQPGEAVKLARHVIDVMGQAVRLEAEQVVLGVNVGIATAVTGELDAELLLQQATIALNRAKVEGRGRYRLFEPEMDELIQARRSLEWDLREAVRTMAFEIRYQPQFDTRTKRVNGFEALLRWTHPVHGAIAPGVFVPLAEEIGLIGRVTEWTLRRACSEAAGWPGQISVAVNISALLLADRKLPDVVAGALKHSGLSPSQLELEITETGLMANPTEAAVTLADLRASGVKIALDDFGTGYSSLSYLADLPFDKVKIDRSFIARLHEGDAQKWIVRAIIGLSVSLGVVCTAEGIETEEQLHFLERENCPSIQGFLLGRPIAGQEVPGMLSAASLAAQSIGPLPGRSPATSDEERPGILFEQIVNAANDVIIVTDANLEAPGPKILYVNPAFTRLTGFNAPEAIGKSPRILQGPGTSRVTLREIEAGLRAGLEVHKKVLNYAKCGAPYWLDLRIVPLRDGAGTVTGFVAVERDVTLDKRRLDELEYISDRDTLTGAPNRRALLRIVDAELQAARSRGAAGPCLAFIDVDHFKNVNDQFGHATGDTVLFGIADCIAENMRRVDMLGRIGGEEFAVCMPSIGLREAAAIGERLRQAVAAKAFETPSGPLRITVSIGVSEARRDEHSLADFMERADRAMYVSKRSGRDQVTTNPSLPAPLAVG